MKRVLLTGATGFLGRYIVSQLKGCYEFFTLGRSAHPELSCHIPLQFDSARSLKAEIRARGAEVIVHTAAISSAKECEKFPERAHEINTRFTAHLTEAASERNVPIIYTSTDLVFDGCQQIPEGGFTEESQPQPLSVYASSKRAGEEQVLKFDKGVVLRLSLLYGSAIGPRSGPLGWMIKAFQAGEKVNLFRDEWRTPIYVLDVVFIIEKVLEGSLQHNLYHLAGNERVNRVEFGELLANRFGFDCDLIHSGNREDLLLVPPRPEDVSLNNQLLKEELGLSPRSLSQALGETSL